MVAGAKIGISKAAKRSLPKLGMGMYILGSSLNAQLIGENAKSARLEYTFSLKKRLVLFTFVILITPY